jgi:hypothetical protein
MIAQGGFRKLPDVPDLPTELGAKIFYYLNALDALEMCQYRLVSTRWLNLVKKMPVCITIHSWPEADTLKVRFNPYFISSPSSLSMPQSS